MFTRWGDIAYRWRRVVPVIVVAVIALLYLLVGTKLGDRMSSEGWDDPHSESTRAAQIEQDVFGRDASGDVILLVTRDRVPEETAAALASLGTTSIAVVGGTAAVSDEVATALGASGAVVNRVAGATRYETSAAVAALARDAGMASTDTGFATGRNFPDALAAGPAVARSGGNLLLVEGADVSRSPEALDWLTSHLDILERVVLVGGVGAVSEASEDLVRTTAEIPEQ